MDFVDSSNGLITDLSPLTPLSPPLPNDDATIDSGLNTIIKSVESINLDAASTTPAFYSTIVPVSLLPLLLLPLFFLINTCLAGI